MTRPILIDSDTLSHIMRRTPSVRKRARSYTLEHGKLTFSVMTWFEVLRGLKARNAAKQLKAFDAFCAANTILPLSRNIVSRATDVYADLYRKGRLIGDADILIAATALEHDMDLATNNSRHFENVVGLTLVNWLDLAD